jgi:hypothetical protein
MRPGIAMTATPLLAKAIAARLVTEVMVLSRVTTMSLCAAGFFHQLFRFWSS